MQNRRSGPASPIRRYYGEKMMADGTDAAYPPTPSEEQQWQDGVGYNSYPIGTKQQSTITKDSTGRVTRTPGPVQTAYGKTISSAEFGGAQPMERATYGTTHKQIIVPIAAKK